MSHDHSHSTTNRTRLTIALGITGTVVLAEIVGAFLTNSLALLVDAAHMLTDTLGLVVALIAAILMARPPSSRRTWGWRRIEVIAAGVQAIILLAVGTYAIIEGIQRLFNPPEVLSEGLLAVGALGLAANIVSLFVISGGRDSNLNMKAAFLEVAADALGSIAVLIAAAVMWFTGWMHADAIASLIVAGMIIPRAVILLRQSGSILLETTPDGLDLTKVREHMLGLPHVIDVHDLHASLIGTGLPVITAHVVLSDECFTTGHSLELLERLHTCLETHHAISVEHSTFQLETRELAEQHTAHGDSAHQAMCAAG